MYNKYKANLSTQILYYALTTFQTMTVLSADLLWNNRNE